MRLIDPAAMRPAVRIANRHAVPRGQAWGPRTIPDLQFICPLRGTLFHRDERGEVLVRPGQVLCILPEVRHVVGLAPGEARGELAGMHLELVPDGRWAAGDYRCDPLPPRVATPDGMDGVRDAFIRAASVFGGYHRQRAALLSAIAAEALLRCAPAWGATAAAPLGGRTAPLVAHIRAHAVRGVDRHELARIAGLTPEHVNALFKRELGLTPREVLNHERCRIAWRLIHEDGVAVATAAARAGYDDAFYFSRVFKALYGVPPSRVR